MKFPRLPRPDWYLLLAATSLAMTIPFSIAAFAHGKGVDVGDGWFFALAPGVGMALCGTAGNAAVVGAILTFKLSAAQRSFLVVVATISFLSMFFVLPAYLFTDYAGISLIEALPGWQARAWFVAILAMAELQAPALVVVSQVKRQAATAALRAADEVSHETRAAVPPRILTALSERDGRTAKDLSRAVGATVATVGKHLKKLEVAGRVHGAEDLQRGARVWRLGKAA